MDTFVSGLYKAIVVFLNGFVNERLTSFKRCPRYKSNAKWIFVLRSVTESIAYSTPHTMNISPTCKIRDKNSIEKVFVFFHLKICVCLCVLYLNFPRNNMMK